jgi:phosphotransferase system enzyme I (PtsI)
MAGDPHYTRLLIGMGLRTFSMHPAQILEVKQEILRSDSADLSVKVAKLLRQDEPERIGEAVGRL